MSQPVAFGGEEIDRQGGLEWEEFDWWEEHVHVCGGGRNNENRTGCSSEEEVPAQSPR